MTGSNPRIPGFYEEFVEFWAHIVDYLQKYLMDFLWIKYLKKEAYT